MRRKAENMTRQTESAIITHGEATPIVGHKGQIGIDARIYCHGPDDHANYLLVALDIIEPGGEIRAHYHEGLEADHAYFLVDGEVMARIGDEEFHVGPNSLMVFRSDVVHGFRVVSPSGARVLRLGASTDGRTTGGHRFADAEVR